MKTTTINMDALRFLLANQRQDIKKGICSKEEALVMLGVSEKELYNLLGDKEHTLIKRSTNKRGKFIYSSLIKEFERIHGIPYKDAIAA